jgi:hypothetical protein
MKAKLINEAFEQKSKEEARRDLLFTENWNMIISSPCVSTGAEEYPLPHTNKDIIVSKINELLETYFEIQKDVDGNDLTALEIGDVFFWEGEEGSGKDAFQSSKQFYASEIIIEKYPDAKNYLDLWVQWWDDHIGRDRYSGNSEIIDGIVEISKMKLKK